MSSDLIGRTITRGAALVVVVAALLWFGGGSASAAPALVVTPSADLLDGQTVQVSGSGFGVSAKIYAAMCPADATISAQCDTSSVTMATADGSGSFSMSFNVARYFMALDCAVDACSIGVTDLSSSALAPVSFRNVPPPTPAITVSPDHGLVDGSVVTISGTGFRPGGLAQPGQCPPGAIAINFCNQPGGAAVVSPDGTFRAQVPAERILALSATSIDDCAVSQCTIGVDALGELTTAPISFAKPVFTASIASVGTLTAGTDLVVVRATVSCDIATPLTVLTVVTQPGIAGQFQLDRRQCTPGDPFEGYYPTRTVSGAGHFSLGSAAVQLTISPSGGHAIDAPASSNTTVTGSTDLVDDAQIRATILAQIQDPANVELRQAVFHGLQLRLQQDPVFAAEFFHRPA